MDPILTTEKMKVRPSEVDGFPQIPNSLSRDEIKFFLNDWAMNPKKQYSVAMPRSTTEPRSQYYRGGFALTFPSGLKYATAKRGPKQDMVCTRYGTPSMRKTNIAPLKRLTAGSLKCGCPFKLTLEQCLEGFKCTEIYPHHSHELTQNISEANAVGTTRTGISDDFVKLARQMHRGGVNPGRIFHTLQENVKFNGDLQTFTYDDVYNLLRPSNEDLKFDASNYINVLKQTGRPYEFELTGVDDINPNSLYRVFDVKQGGLETWGRNMDFSLKIGSLDNILDEGLQHGKQFYCHEKQVVYTIISLDDDKDTITLVSPSGVEEQFDRGAVRISYRNYLLTDKGLEENPALSRAVRQEIHRSHMVIFDTTFSTNRYGFKLGLFITVNEHLRTVVLAQTLLMRELKEDFVWAFEQFLKYFKIPPVVIFTDSDKAMAYAIREVLPTTMHLLCTYHISKNIHTHFHSLLNNKKKTWSKFIRKWWNICLHTDSQSVVKFDDEWSELIAIIRDDEIKSSDKLNNALSWLATLKEKKEQWAARYTWRYATYGCHSTQRIESLHSAIKGHMSKNLLLTELHKHLENWSILTADKQETESYKRAMRNLLEPQSLPHAVTLLQNVVTPEAYKIVTQQASFALSYIFIETTQKGVFQISRNDVGTQSGQSPQDDTGSGQSTQDDTGHSNLWSSLASDGLLKDELMHVRYTSAAYCTCQFPRSWKLPCRHQIPLLMSGNISDLRPSIGSRWLKSSGDNSEKCADSLTSLVLPCTTKKRSYDQSQVTFDDLMINITPQFRRAQALCESKEDAEYFSNNELQEIIAKLRSRKKTTKNQSNGETTRINNPLVSQKKSRSRMKGLDEQYKGKK